jgi:hypothetical protein
MSYQEDWDLYQDEAFRGRAQMCAREQAYIYAEDADPSSSALGRSIIAGSLMDLDAVTAAVVTVPGAGDLATDDQALLSATQTVWPNVAGARYPPL